MSHPAGLASAAKIGGRAGGRRRPFDGYSTRSWPPSRAPPGASSITKWPSMRLAPNSGRSAMRSPQPDSLLRPKPLQYRLDAVPPRHHHWPLAIGGACPATAAIPGPRLAALTGWPPSPGGLAAWPVAEVAARLTLWAAHTGPFPFWVRGDIAGAPAVYR